MYGYPQAHEDDAERAVRAALELLLAIFDRFSEGVGTPELKAANFLLEELSSGTE